MNLQFPVLPDAPPLSQQYSGDEGCDLQSLRLAAFVAHDHIRVPAECMPFKAVQRFAAPGAMSTLCGLTLALSQPVEGGLDLRV